MKLNGKLIEKDGTGKATQVFEHFVWPTLALEAGAPT